MYRNIMFRSNSFIVSKFENLIEELAMQSSSNLRPVEFANAMQIAVFGVFQIYKVEQKVDVKKFISLVELRNNWNHLEGGNQVSPTKSPEGAPQAIQG